MGYLAIACRWRDRGVHQLDLSLGRAEGLTWGGGHLVYLLTDLWGSASATHSTAEEQLRVWSVFSSVFSRPFLYFLCQFLQLSLLSPLE